jgi:hypothetical protein
MISRFGKMPPPPGSHPAKLTLINPQTCLIAQLSLQSLPYMVILTEPLIASGFEYKNPSEDTTFTPVISTFLSTRNPVIEVTLPVY